MVRRARDVWFKEIEKQIQGGRKHRRRVDDDEKQEVTQASTMKWDIGDEMNTIRNYAV